MATKAELCQELYGKMAEASDNGEVVRKDFIARAVAECGCTPAGASTYYSNCKTKHNGGSVKSYYQPADKVKADQSVDDSWADKQLYSIVVVDDGKVAQAHAYTTESTCLATFNKMNPRAMARCLAVMGNPKEGTDVTTLQQLVNPVNS